MALKPVLRVFIEPPSDGELRFFKVGQQTKITLSMFRNGVQQLPGKFDPGSIEARIVGDTVDPDAIATTYVPSLIPAERTIRVGFKKATKMLALNARLSDVDGNVYKKTVCVTVKPKA